MASTLSHEQVFGHLESALFTTAEAMDYLGFLNVDTFHQHVGGLTVAAGRVGSGVTPVFVEGRAKYLLSELRRYKQLLEASQKTKEAYYAN